MGGNGVAVGATFTVGNWVDVETTPGKPQEERINISTMSAGTAPKTFFIASLLSEHLHPLQYEVHLLSPAPILAYLCPQLKMVDDVAHLQTEATSSNRQVSAW